MYRGITRFKCDHCGNTFKAMDTEWNATIFSTPQRCPKCGSYHTMPTGFLNIIYKPVYKKIWNYLDNKYK